MSTKQEILTEETFETERGDKVTLPEPPAKCWRIDGEDAETANALFTRWQELRAELAAAEAAFVDQTRGLEKLEAEAEEKKAAALVSAAIIGGDDPKADSKMDKAVQVARAELAATQDRCAILPRAILQCASRWAREAAECLLNRLHESSPAADALAAEIETEIPRLIMEWRALGKTQAKDARGLASICEACGGSIKTGTLRLLCGDSLSNRAAPAFAQVTPSVVLRTARQHHIRASAFLTGELNAGF